jgi:Domain of unknown function (DUF4249)
MKMIVVAFLLLLTAEGCIQKFMPSLNSTPTGYLVVEGIINSGGGPASVTLTRTTNLSDTSKVAESGAMVQVEGNDNSIYLFIGQGNGVYGIPQLGLNSTLLYRLRIKTEAGEEYLSDFAPVETTPLIDSINWQLKTSGVQIYANTHDPQHNAHYYKWDFVETWEYHSSFPKQLNYDTPYVSPTGTPYISVAYYPGGTDTSIYTCWQSDESTEILLASTIALSSDVITDFPITYIPQTSIKLTNEYSILVNQYALTADAYNFLQLLKSNTEETGSIFSPQPSLLQGNIHSLTNPGETVVGYVGFCSVQSERIFIYNAQFPVSWSQYNPGCTQDSVYIEDPYNSYYPQEQIQSAIVRGLIPTISIDINRFLAAPAMCVDCTLTGTNQKPTFWQ